MIRITFKLIQKLSFVLKAFSNYTEKGNTYQNRGEGAKVAETRVIIYSPLEIWGPSIRIEIQ
jgi:hypothetical protein